MTLLIRQPVDFRSRIFLLEHIRHTLSFYDDKCVDPEGGFYHCYMNNGEVFDPGVRTLVASCRFIFNYAKAYQQFQQTVYLDNARHGLDYLRSTHRDPETGGYAWRIENGVVTDSTNRCYGLAFVMLAYVCSLQVGISEALEWIEETYALMEQRFWNKGDQLYACEADNQWQLTNYRGQNDNMHACEAMIAAYEVTGQVCFLDRACVLAERIALMLPKKTSGHIWEHFTCDWHPDLEYNKHDLSNSLRPWGVQTGHQTEWAKLLLILDRYRPESWRQKQATALFEAAMDHGWDHMYGGLFYGYDLNGTPCYFDKYFWVQAESIAAAALLADCTGEERFWEWYDRLWEYSFNYFVDHKYGAWYRILKRDNTRYDNRKSYNNKADYHTMGACYEILKIKR